MAAVVLVRHSIEHVVGVVGLLRFLGRVPLLAGSLAHRRTWCAAHAGLGAWPGVLRPWAPPALQAQALQLAQGKRRRRRLAGCFATRAARRSRCRPRALAAGGAAGRRTLLRWTPGPARAPVPAQEQAKTEPKFQSKILDKRDRKLNQNKNQECPRREGPPFL